MTSSIGKTGGGFGWPVFGSVAALVVCPALELITGAEWSYTLPIFVFFFLFWGLTRMSRAEIGFRVGGPGAYIVSLVYAFLALSTVGAAAMLGGEGGLSSAPLGKSMILALQMFAATWIGTIITEDGFFRGWLWGSLSRTRLGVRGILIWTSLVFALWHLPVAVIEENFKLPAEVIPVYIVNVLLLGVAWGIIRLASGSIVTAAFCHGIWNGIVYTFFGYGTTSGALGITNYKVYDPERGLLGLAVNAIAVVLLWAWASRKLKSMG
jgi:membrane protease YdiL (CAAX protease family)